MQASILEKIARMGKIYCLLVYLDIIMDFMMDSMMGIVKKLLGLCSCDDNFSGISFT